MRIYSLKSCIPIYHGNTEDRQEAHCHTIEVVAHIEERSGKFVLFSYVEAALERCLNRYRGEFLNALPEFGGDTSIEGIGETLFVQVSEALEEQELVLKRLEVSETPLRRYVIGTADE